MINLANPFEKNEYAIVRGGNKFKIIGSCPFESPFSRQYPVFKVVYCSDTGMRITAFYYQDGRSIEGQNSNWDIVSVVKEMDIQTDDILAIFVPQAPSHKRTASELQQQNETDKKRRC